MTRLRRAMLAAAVVSLTVTACSSFDAAEAQGPVDGGGLGVGEGGAPPAAESCVDGRDDNGDGRADCEEPTCGPYVRCVPSLAVVGNWDGYSTFSDDGSCPPDLPQSEEMWQADPKPLACPSCTCTPDTQCDVSVSVDQSPYAGCSAGVLPLQIAPSQCTAIPKPAGGFATTWLVSSAGQTVCTPTASGPPPAPAPAHRAVRVCTGALQTGTGCPSGSLCVQRRRLCVSRAALAGAPFECPAAFPVRSFMVSKSAGPAGAFTDTRACTPCGCGAGNGGGCDRTLSLHAQAGCAGTGTSVKSGSCVSATCAGGCNSALLSVVARQGTCGPPTGGATGTVSLAAAGVQFCCNEP